MTERVLLDGGLLWYYNTTLGNCMAYPIRKAPLSEAGKLKVLPSSQDIDQTGLPCRPWIPVPAAPRTLHVAVEHDGERVEEQDAAQLRRAADAHPLLAHAEAAHLHRMRALWGQRW